MKKPRHNYLKWNRLDNTAHLFPVIAREGMSNVYRVSVVLHEEIDGELLKEAQDAVLPFFDTFRCSLKKGFFWYYFEENRRDFPPVEEEENYPCLYMNPYSNNRYLFRLSYYGCRIDLEVFHALTDGNGAFSFLKEITYCYLRKKHPEDLGISEDMPDRETSFDKSDSYLENYTGREKRPYKTDKAVRIRGERLADGQLSVIHGILPLHQLKAAAKKHEATINQYLVAVYTWAIYLTTLRGLSSEIPINVCVPVNLRPVYGSETGKNFFVMLPSFFKPERSRMAFEEVLEIVKEDLSKRLTKENLERLFSYNVSNQTNLALRAVPLFIKRVVMKQVYKASAKGTTTTLTNLGVIPASEAYEQYIERFQAILAMSENQNIKLTAVSHKDTAVLTFSSCLEETQIQREFFRRLSKDGMEICIETNGVCYEQ